MRKGFSLVELLIAIGLLGIIMAAVFGIFSTATKNYRLQSQKSFLQKELNFVTDSLGNEIKTAIGTADSYAGFNLSSNTLILAVPAINESEEFVYSAGTMAKDYIIYTKEGTTLRKIVIPDPASSRSEKDFTVLSDVSGMMLTYQPNILSPRSVKAEITLERTVGKHNVRINAVKTGFLRNK